MVPWNFPLTTMSSSPESSPSNRVPGPRTVAAEAVRPEPDASGELFESGFPRIARNRLPKKWKLSLANRFPRGPLRTAPPAHRRAGRGRLRFSPPAGWG
jgi:hypothetical protein